MISKCRHCRSDSRGQKLFRVVDVLTVLVISTGSFRPSRQILILTDGSLRAASASTCLEMSYLKKVSNKFRSSKWTRADPSVPRFRSSWDLGRKSFVSEHFPTVDLATPWSICSQWSRPQKNSQILTEGSRGCSAAPVCQRSVTIRRGSRPCPSNAGVGVRVSEFRRARCQSETAGVPAHDHAAAARRPPSVEDQSESAGVPARVLQTQGSEFRVSE